MTSSWTRRPQSHLYRVLTKTSACLPRNAFQEVAQVWATAPWGCRVALGSHVCLCTKQLLIFWYYHSLAISDLWTTEGHDTRVTNICLISTQAKKFIREGYFPSLPETSRWCPSGLPWQKEIKSLCPQESSVTLGESFLGWAADLITCRFLSWRLEGP